VIQITQALEAQFGIVSAGGFPPHATIVGNLRTDLNADELVTLLDPVFDGLAPFPVFNKGVERGGNSFVFNVNEDGKGNPNLPLGALADRVRAAVRSASVHVEDFLVPPVASYTFKGHLSLASHDLYDNPNLAHEVGEFLGGLPIGVPDTFEANVFSLFEFEGTWDGEWWLSMTWKHQHSWLIPSHQ